jgi:hypothetical protein
VDRSSSTHGEWLLSRLGASAACMTARNRLSFGEITLRRAALVVFFVNPD